MLYYRENPIPSAFKNNQREITAFRCGASLVGVLVSFVSRLSRVAEQRAALFIFGVVLFASTSRAADLSLFSGAPLAEFLLVGALAHCMVAFGGLFGALCCLWVIRAAERQSRLVLALVGDSLARHHGSATHISHLDPKPPHGSVGWWLVGPTPSLATSEICLPTFKTRRSSGPARASSSVLALCYRHSIFHVATPLLAVVRASSTCLWTKIWSVRAMVLPPERLSLLLGWSLPALSSFFDKLVRAFGALAVHTRFWYAVGTLFCSCGCARHFCCGRARLSLVMGGLRFCGGDVAFTRFDRRTRRCASVNNCCPPGNVSVSRMFYIAAVRAVDRARHCLLSP